MAVDRIEQGSSSTLRSEQAALEAAAIVRVLAKSQVHRECLLESPVAMDSLIGAMLNSASSPGLVQSCAKTLFALMQHCPLAKLDGRFSDINALLNHESLHVVRLGAKLVCTYGAQLPTAFNAPEAIKALQIQFERRLDAECCTALSILCSLYPEQGQEVCFFAIRRLGL